MGMFQPQKYSSTRHESEKLIEQNVSSQKLRQIMEESHLSYGMQTFNQSIAQLLNKKTYFS